MLKDKNILLLCKEKSSFPMYSLGKELEKNNNVDYFFIYGPEVLNKTINYRQTYFYFKDKIDPNKIHDVNDLNIKFLKNRKNIKINFDRLKEIEKRYTHFNCLNQQLLSSQSTSTPHHTRYYFNPTSYEENLYWLLLNYDKAEDIFDKIKPDCIFDLYDTGEIQRTIINEIAFHKKIPYVNKEHSRYQSYNIPTFTLGRSSDYYFENRYTKNRNENIDNLKEYINEVKEYQSQKTIMPLIYKGTNTTSYNYSLFQMIRFIIVKIRNFIKQQFDSFLNDEFKLPMNTPLHSHPYKRLLFAINTALKKYYLYSKLNNHFEAPKDEKYIYMPLHKVPESSTYIKSPMYVNESIIIEAISKLLPIDWVLYVKEHQDMLGEREIQFYKKIKKIQNVRLVKLNYYKDPKPWIEKSMGVVTISGTTAFEASMLNIPAIVFGHVQYNVIPGIKLAKNIEELGDIFKLIESNKWIKDNTNDCAAYLKTIKEVGIPINLAHFVKMSAKKITSDHLNIDEENDLQNMISMVQNFYERALMFYYEKK